MRGAIDELARVHEGATLSADSDTFKLSEQDRKIRDDTLIWVSPPEAASWGCGSLATIAEVVLGVVKPIEERRPNWASLLQPPRKCMVSNYRGPAGHYVAHRDGIPLDRAGADLAAAKQEMHKMITDGYWAEGGNFVATIKESAGAMKTVGDAKHSNREITCICYLNDDDWDAERDGGALRLFVGTEAGDELGVTAKSHVDVAPGSGTLVLFNSRTMLHEVRPTRRPRHALSAWIETRSSRPKD